MATLWSFAKFTNLSSCQSFSPYGITIHYSDVINLVLHIDIISFIETHAESTLT